jgi:hypothetical protein
MIQRRPSPALPCMRRGGRQANALQRAWALLLPPATAGGGWEGVASDPTHRSKSKEKRTPARTLDPTAPLPDPPLHAQGRETSKHGHRRSMGFAPPPATVGGDEARLRAIGSRAEERLSAMREGRNGWEGLASDPTRRTKSKENELHPELLIRRHPSPTLPCTQGRETSERTAATRAKRARRAGRYAASRLRT